MAQHVKLQTSGLKELRKVDERLMSYNVEMTEVTGGTFWKAYTKEQIEGTEQFPLVTSFADFANLMQVYPPIDLYNAKLRALAKEFGPVWMRVSGTWASKTYYDFDGTAGGKAPEGYQNVLTRAQWIGVLDFVKAVGAKLIISVANCAGLHDAGEPWNPSEAEKIFSLSKEYGVPIDAAEFMNEPNMLERSGAPVGYTAADYARDQDLFFAWVRKNYPGTLLVGPCNTGGADKNQGIGAMSNKNSSNKGGGIAELMGDVPSLHALMEGTGEKLDVYSYHYYNGISERLAGMMPGAHWDASKAHTEEYMEVAAQSARANVPGRDRYCPGGQMWVTESGDAGGGGDTWASTYLDVLRTLNELAEFATITDGVIFHNTLASSDYGFLQHGTFDPRPNYFAALLWNRLMGATVYDSGEPLREGARVYTHGRKDGKPGMVYMIINNSLTETTAAELPCAAERYTLSAETLRSPVMLLNGKPLVLTGESTLPEFVPVQQAAGTAELAPATVTFFVL